MPSRQPPWSSSTACYCSLSRFTAVESQKLRRCCALWAEVASEGEPLQKQIPVKVLSYKIDQPIDARRASSLAECLDRTDGRKLAQLGHHVRPGTTRELCAHSQIFDKRARHVGDLLAVAGEHVGS